MISHVSSRPNWYLTHVVCNKRVFFFKNCYYFSDLETQWPRNPELDFACLQQLSEGVSHNIEENRGGRKRLPKFKFSAKFPIGLHVILQIQIKKFEIDCYIMWKIILTENPPRCNLAPLLK